MERMERERRSSKILKRPLKGSLYHGQEDLLCITGSLYTVERPEPISIPRGGQ